MHIVIFAGQSRPPDTLSASKSTDKKTSTPANVKTSPQHQFSTRFFKCGGLPNDLFWLNVKNLSEVYTFLYCCLENMSLRHLIKC